MISGGFPMHVNLTFYMLLICELTWKTCFAYEAFMKFLKF